MTFTPARRDRRGFAKDVLKPGDVVEVCGYVPKEATVWQIASTDPRAVSPSGRLLNAEVLMMPDGHEQSWGDYGVHKCYEPGYKDQHSNRSRLSCARMYRSSGAEAATVE